MKKIFFVIKALDNVGGTERVTIVIANALVQKGYEVHIVSLEGNYHPYTPVQEQVKLHYLVQGKDGLFFPFKDMRRHQLLKALFQKEQPDCIILVDAARMMAKMPSCKGFITVAWEHFNTAISTRFTHTLSRKYMAHHANAVVTLTQSDAEVYQTRFQAHNALCIPNPITIPITSCLAQRKPIVLAVGRLTEQKGFDLLLQAWSQIADKKGWKLQIVGKGKLAKSLHQLAHQLQVQDSVEFLPPTPQIATLYQTSSIFALSSRFEGLPLVLIESGAMGLPAVSFDCKTGPSEIIEQGKTGILVPPENVSAFAKALEKMMLNPTMRQQMSEQAREHIAQKFSVETILDQWEQLFQTLIATN